MGTTLRVGFAMGGGVSLGTFNGAALSQALKLLLLRGRDRNGAPYDRVLLDVFSGASAGSMSLAIMLRGLVEPDPHRRDVARHRLTTEFGHEFTSLPPGARERLLAAQSVQDVQEEIWVREITLKKLLGQGDEEAKGRVHLTAGVVDRGAVEELARRYLSFTGDAVDLSRREILADRVLFASSIANLSPVLADARTEYPTDETGLLGLSDGLTSSVHRELRVFDLHFTDLFDHGGIGPDALTDPDTFPRRWCRYHSGEKVPDTGNSGRGIGSLLQRKGWARIAATSIASGAFPGAFEPVPLERRSYEFGETEEGGTSLWPSRLKGRDRHVFTYVDGGTFNNEPIREAFRLASFMDAQDPEGDFERLIVFVDPHFVVPDPSLRVPHHGAWMLDEPNRLLGSMDGLDLKRKASLDRLLPAGVSLLGAILNESRVVEADKVFRTRKRFSLRNEIREHLHRSLSSQPDVPALKALIARLSLLLAQDRAGVMIPAGALTLDGEVRRILAEEGGDGAPLASLGEKTPAEIRAFLSDPEAGPADELPAWLRALTFVAVDRIMDLEGKMEGSQLIAISPALDPGDPGKLEPLPGGAVSGFGGFTSEIPGRYEVEVARYCAQLFLEAGGRIEAGARPPRPVFPETDRRAYLKELRDGLKSLEGRLVHMIADSHIDILGAVPAGALRFFVEGKLAGLAKGKGEATTCELRLEVPGKEYEFDGEGWGDRDLGPVKIGEKFYLITFATYTRGEGRPWSGHHVEAGKRSLKVDRDRRGPLTDKEFCTVRLPTKVMLESAGHLPYPVWVARIKKTDEGSSVPTDRWELLDEVTGLEASILG